MAYLAPESPWNCVRRGKFDQARQSLVRLRPYASEKEIDGMLALIRHTNMLEEAETKDATFFDAFRGTNLRRTEIVS